MSSLAGQTFAGYEIIAKLGQGGMGAVYKARQPNLDRLAALKVMASELAADPDFVARFKREATAAANLSHPNIVQVYSAGESEGTHYIAMEFVDGVTLKQHIERQGRLDPREAIAITVLVAEALQYGWNKARLIHRDIKPDNIFLSQTGEVKVGDLGLAKTVGGGTTSLTQTGMMMGSPHYISPEQARGLSDVDFKTDIYSLGCTLYHMLTGRPPYEGSDALAVIGKHVHEPPPAIFKVWPTCPIPVALVVGKMLAKQRHERPASYEDLIEQLREVHGKLKPVTAVAPVSASEPTQMLPSPAPAPPTPKPAVAKTPKTPKPRVESRESRAGSRGPKVVIGVGALAVMALIAGAVWWFAGGGGEPKVLDLGGGVKMELVAIPPGEFMMGSTGVEKAWTAAQAYCGLPKNEGEAPRKATIKQGFWMGRTEVTMGQWKQFVNATGYKSEVERMSLTVWTYDPTQKKWEGRKGVTWRDPGFGFSMQDNHPVCCVTWNDAVAFCEWLAQREQEAGCLPAGYKIRLPTEAEWEYGCRAGTQTKFWWGDSVEDAQGRVNWAGEEDGFECVHPADHYGARGRNGFGLADMIGNVPESCLDGYDPKGAHEEFYPGSPDARAMRGAAFWHLPGQSRCACRCMVPTSGAWSGYGFRVCLGPDVLGSASAAPVSTPEPQAAPPAADASGYKPLFNGKDLTGWKVRENANNNWSAEGGVLVNSRSGADLITEETFTDFELHLEFKLPPQGNSGVYLRGRQELQLADDCGQPAGLDTTGGIWGRIAPSENASKPVNEWQTLDVTLIGKEATVTINGRKVINAARISGVSTWAGLDNNVDQPGPIMLQGRLSAVSFRNIRIKPLPAAAAKADETKLLDLGGGVKMELVAIPPGEFLMGSTPEEQAWAVKNRLKEGDVKCEGEMPRKTTIKDGFWLGRTEVTVGQWKEFVTATGYKTDAEKKGYVDAAPRKGKAWGRADGLSWRDPGFGAAPQDNDPVCCVSWNDAMAFCEWATERERKAGRLAANQVARLPAEAEWEYACRAGTQTKFWWGEAKEDGKDRLNWSGKDDGYDFVSPVDTFGKRGRNGFGLADMLGNVLEWCLDEYDAKQAHEECYKGNPGARVLRGGSFFFVPAICRCASRSSGDPAILLAMFGFRVAVGVDVLGSATSAAPAIPADAAAWQNAINLLPLVDIEKDKVSGTWTAANGELTATDVKAASQKLQPPYRPPEEYDCRVSFTPTGGMINVAAGLSVAGRSFVCLIKTNANNHAMGFEAINDKGVGFNPSGVSMPHLECGRRYTVAVEVRKDGVTAYLDGKRMTGWKTDYRDMSPYPIWKFNDDTLLGIGCVKTTAIFHEMKVIEVTGKGTFTRSAPPTSVAVWQNAINLLPLIDPQKDAVEGGWTVQNGELISNQDNYARIEMPYQPPDEYDFRVEFSSPTVKETGPVQLLSKAGREFRWQCFCRPNNSVGFESVGGANIREGLARAELAIRIQSGQRYVSLVEVRNGVVRGYVNGKLCVEWKTDYADMGIFPKWKLRAAGLLGVGSQIPTTFHRIEVREVTGKGTFTRGAPSGASNTPPLQHSNVPAALSAFCAEVAALPAEQQVARVVAKLKELNPGYSGEEKHGIENDKVVRFHIQYQRSITNIAPVRALAGLRDLNIGYDGIRDVSALRGLRLERLHVNSTQVEDLSPLSGMPLAHLLVGGTKVGDLSPLQGVPLETLFIDHCKVSDLAPLKGRPLTCLGISGNPVRDLSPLRGMALWRLDNDGTAVSDLSPLAGMPMRELRIQKTPATDLSPLAGMPLQKLECEPAVAAQPANARILRSIKTLETINGQPAAEFWKKVEAEQAAREAFIREMAALPAEQQVARVVAKLKELNPGFDGKEGHKIENGIVSSFSFRSTGVTNISPVRALSKLEGLGCAGFTGPVPKGEKSPLEDLSPLRGLPLRWLNCSYSRVADLSPLRGMPLEMLYCHDTQVKDFTPLQGMPLKELVCFGVPISNLTPLSTLHLLEELVCSATPVQDLSPLKGLRLRKLTLGNTPVSDLSPLTGAPLKELYVVRTRVSDLSPLRGAPLEKINYDAIVNSRAENMQVLKSIPTLQTINGQPAAEFWKKAEVGERPKP